VLRLTAAGASLLRGEGQCALYRQAAPLARRTKVGLTRPGSPELFDELRTVRLRLARERGVPPYVIFHDTTLREMAERRPQTFDDLDTIYGVGAKKAADFGQAFLEVTRRYSTRQ
jgi:ATP-dependent DNA helicase RecQ